MIADVSNIASGFEVLDLQHKPRETLHQIDQSVDWSRFERYLIWLSVGPVERRMRAPLMLFKALLLRQWFKLRAIDFDYDVADRLSYRKFIGLRDDEIAPTYAEVTSFSERLVARGIATEVFSELQTQFLRGDLGRMLVQTGRGIASGQAEFLAYQGVSKPPEWLEIEQRFQDYWESLRGDEDIPAIDEFRFSDIPDLMPHTALIRVLNDGDGFRYEFMGETLTESNGGSTVGMTIEMKIENNVRDYGHAGFQGELFRLFTKSLKERCTVSTSEYFANAAGQKCQIWLIVGPIGDKCGDIELLFSAAYIKALSIN